MEKVDEFVVDNETMIIVYKISHELKVVRLYLGTDPWFDVDIDETMTDFEIIQMLYEIVEGLPDLPPYRLVNKDTMSIDIMCQLSDCMRLRTFNVLKRRNVNSVDKIKRLTAEQFITFRNLGMITMHNLIMVFYELGYTPTDAMYEVQEYFETKRKEREQAERKE